MIWKRWEKQNAVASIQRWNEEIVEIDSVEELLCVNMVKHRKPLPFTKSCPNYIFLNII